MDSFHRIQLRHLPTVYINIGSPHGIKCSASKFKRTDGCEQVIYLSPMWSIISWCCKSLDLDHEIVLELHKVPLPIRLHYRNQKDFFFGGWIALHLDIKVHGFPWQSWIKVLRDTAEKPFTVCSLLNTFP